MSSAGPRPALRRRKLMITLGVGIILAVSCLGIGVGFRCD
jgi:hypothetical protein